MVCVFAATFTATPFCKFTSFLSIYALVCIKIFSTTPLFQRLLWRKNKEGLFGLQTSLLYSANKPCL